jgi:hypothetical protein
MSYMKTIYLIWTLIRHQQKVVKFSDTDQGVKLKSD